ERCAVAKEREAPLVDQTLRLRSPRRVDRDDVRLAEEIFELAVLAEIGVHAPALRVEHAELEAAGASRDGSADATEPDAPPRRAGSACRTPRSPAPAYEPRQRPERTSLSSSTTRRRTARMSANVRSAVAASSTPGVFVTAMPRAASAATSIRS